MPKNSKLMVIDRPQEEAREREPHNVAAPAGLCTNCDHAATCTFQRPTGQPIAYCDEWTCEDSMPNPIQNAGTDQDEIEMKREWAMEAEARPKGLCMTCEAYPTCMFPKPPDGVWHCEEYC